MDKQDAQQLFTQARAGDPAALEFVVATICEHLLETNYERAVALLREQHDRCLKILVTN